MEDLDVTDTPLLPLFGGRIEAVEFGSVREDDLLVLFARFDFDQGRQRDDRFKMSVARVVGSVVFAVLCALFTIFFLVGWTRLRCKMQISSQTTFLRIQLNFTSKRRCPVPDQLKFADLLNPTLPEVVARDEKDKSAPLGVVNFHEDIDGVVVAGSGSDSSVLGVGFGAATSVLTGAEAGVSGKSSVHPRQPGQGGADSYKKKLGGNFKSAANFN